MWKRVTSLRCFNYLLISGETVRKYRELAEHLMFQLSFDFCNIYLSADPFKSVIDVSTIF